MRLQTDTKHHEMKLDETQLPKDRYAQPSAVADWEWTFGLFDSWKFIENTNFLTLSVALFNGTEIKRVHVLIMWIIFKCMRIIPDPQVFLGMVVHMQAVFISCKRPGYKARIRNALKIWNFRY